MKKNIKISDGITLIALVVTIIVLLILAGITITMLKGDNGILSQTEKSAILTDLVRNRRISKFNLFR